MLVITMYYRQRILLPVEVRTFFRLEGKPGFKCKVKITNSPRKYRSMNSQSINLKCYATFDLEIIDVIANEIKKMSIQIFTILFEVSILQLSRFFDVNINFKKSGFVIQRSVQLHDLIKFIVCKDIHLYLKFT